jgi:hypothetical protein
MEVSDLYLKKRNNLSNEDYLAFLKECDIYIYITLYNTPNVYEFPIKEPTDNYYWVSMFYGFRSTTKEHLDFAIEKISACLEWAKKKNEETNGGMLEWVEKNEKHLEKLKGKRKYLN